MITRRTIIQIFIAAALYSVPLISQMLHLPERESSAPTGSQFYLIIAPLSREAREDSIFFQMTHGNIPRFLRALDTVRRSGTINGTTYLLEYYVTAEYMSVGCDSDYFLMPMTPVLAQRIADALDCMLPTAMMVDQIYRAAPLKLPPQPIPPDAEMITVARFWQHNDSVRKLRGPMMKQFPLGSLVGGTKKDVIIDPKIYSSLKSKVPRPVVIYGWHRLDGNPIQPVYNGHGETYADYSHGIRLISRHGKINGADVSLIDILEDPSFCSLIADSVIVKPFYTTSGSNRNQ